MTTRSFPQVRRLTDVTALRDRLVALGLDLPVDDIVDPFGPLAQALPTSAGPVGNRLAILPMEGWDGTEDGGPTALVERRWRRFGASGAKLIWGGEAVAVRADGRANPRQLRIGPDTVAALAGLRAALVDEHARACGSVDDLVVGLQLTHSGRWARPAGAPEPRPARRDPVLDRRQGGGGVAMTDDELRSLADAFVDAAALAADAGFSFVDVKACHGYLLHELLSGYERGGAFGGSRLGERARFLVDLIARIRHRCPGLGVGVRLSVFDVVPHRAGAGGVGEPEWTDPSRPHDELRRFGTGPDGEPDGREALALVDLLADAGVSLVCVTAGSPYYSPHVQRPAFFPPSDGYLPPEDPLVGVARLVGAARAVKQHRPELVVVGSGYSYLQEWVGHVGQAVVARGWADSIGLGRMALSYPRLPADLLGGRALDRRHLCRTFSDCTTAPRHGLVSGCYPLDEHYRNRPERAVLARIKRRGPGSGEDDEEEPGD